VQLAVDHVEGRHGFVSGVLGADGASGSVVAAGGVSAALPVASVPVGVGVAGDAGGSFSGPLTPQAASEVMPKVAAATDTTAALRNRAMN
jgi:hypothetical protein